MTLTLATLIPGILLLVLGALFLLSNSAIISMFKAFPRSQSAAFLLFGAASMWFLYHMLHLSLADFGEYKRLIFFFFAAVAIGAFVWMPEFLAVRGAAGLILLGAHPLLYAAYMQYDQPQRLFLVSILYLFIFAAIWAGASPYIVRDFFDWVYRVAGRARIIGTALAVYGLVLCGVAFTY